MRFLDTEPTAPTAPTAAEIAAGVDLIGTPQAEELAEMSGWVISPSTIPTPGYASQKVGVVPGDETYPDSMLAFYKDDTVETIYSAMVPGDTGFVAIMRDGDSVGDEVELFPVTIQSRVRRPARDAAHIVDVNFAVSVPYIGVIAA